MRSQFQSGTPSVVPCAGPAEAGAPAGRLTREKVAAFVRLGRPKFLLYSLLLFALGAALSAHDGGRLQARWYVIGQLFVWSVHLMTHYCNEYFDLPADLANTSPTRWTGGSRVLVEGALSPVVSLGASFVFLFFSLGLMVTLPTPAARSVALLAVGLAWFYTAPPLQFNYMGLGELTVAVVLNLLFPVLGCYLQAGTMPALLLLVCGPIMLVQHARMMVMNLADHDGDARIGKRTCAVVLGPRRTVLAFAAEQTVAYALVLVFTCAGHIPAAVGLSFLLTAPVAVWQTWRLLGGAIRDPLRSNSVVFWASTHVALTICAPTVGLLVDSLADPSRRAVVSYTALAVPGVVVVIFAVFLSRQVWQNRVPSQLAPRREANMRPLSNSKPVLETNIRPLSNSKPVLETGVRPLSNSNPVLDAAQATLNAVGERARRSSAPPVFRHAG